MECAEPRWSTCHRAPTVAPHTSRKCSYSPTSTEGSSQKTSHTEKNTERNTVLIIRRSRGRKFSQFQEIEDAVKSLADEYGFRYELYPDEPMPSFEDAMQMFNRAVMVVGPHGAGLSNLLFSQPGTVVIEGVCNPPHVNMCYQRTAHILGHRYHGVASQGGCEKVIQIQPTVIRDIVETHMKLVKGRSTHN